MKRKKRTAEEQAARDVELEARIQELRERANRVTEWLEARKKKSA